MNKVWGKVDGKCFHLLLNIYNQPSRRCQRGRWMTLADRGAKRKTHRGLPPAHILSRPMMFLRSALFPCSRPLCQVLVFKSHGRVTCRRQILALEHVEGHDKISGAPYQLCPCVNY